MALRRRDGAHRQHRRRVGHTLTTGLLRRRRVARQRGRPRRGPAVAHVARSAPWDAPPVATVLATRGFLGLAGRTDLVSPGSNSTRFRRNDPRSSGRCASLWPPGLRAACTTNRHARDRRERRVVDGAVDRGGEHDALHRAARRRTAALLARCEVEEDEVLGLVMVVGDERPVVRIPPEVSGRVEFGARAA